MGKCSVFSKRALTVSGSLGVCLNCIRERPEEALKITGQKHATSRAAFGLSPRIPYTLLAFQPSYVMNDLPTTNMKHALTYQKAAEQYLKNTKIGNVPLLS